jgi:hypothetical protein
MELMKTKVPISFHDWNILFKRKTIKKDILLCLKNKMMILKNAFTMSKKSTLKTFMILGGSIGKKERNF